MPTDGSPASDAGRHDADDAAAKGAGGHDPTEPGAEVTGAEAAAAGEGPDPLRFSRWMRESATGAVLTGVTVGLQRALERRDQRPAIVVDAPGEPEGEEPLIRLRFDPDDPSNTVAVVRHEDPDDHEGDRGREGNGPPDGGHGHRRP
ncbi:MAG: hypothetical protein JO368_05390 [Acidimicrobiales bacterium]|nr:hypothetical protein [Acidimicrobiales bacterium]